MNDQSLFVQTSELAGVKTNNGNQSHVREYEENQKMIKMFEKAKEEIMRLK